MYYLSDMSKVGCMFVIRDLIGGSKRRMIVTCDLFMGDKAYVGKAVVYQDGRPAKLIDILGKDREDARRNLREVSRFMNARFEENTNGVASDALSRSKGTALWILALAVCIASLFFSSFRYFLGERRYLSGMILFAILFLISVFCKPSRMKLLFNR